LIAEEEKEAELDSTSKARESNVFTGQILDLLRQNSSSQLADNFTEEEHLPTVLFSITKVSPFTRRVKPMPF
jgi:hypothetical protein